MPFGVFRIRKYNSKSAVNGIETHVERRASVSHTNPQIDRAQSSKNYDLHGKFDETFMHQVNERLEEAGITPKRKDAVLVAELFFSASPALFENMPADKIRQYFTKCYKWACKKYGKENVISSIVHLDETTPHMHLFFVPITKDNRLCANDFFGNGGKLSKLQDEVHEEIFKEYGLQRGLSAKETNRKHVETFDWKVEQVRLMDADIEEKKKEIAELEQQRDNNELYKVRQSLHSLQDKMSQMFEVLENNPKLMKEYKETIEQLKNIPKGNMIQPEI